MEKHKFMLPMPFDINIKLPIYSVTYILIFFSINVTLIEYPILCIGIEKWDEN